MTQENRQNSKFETILEAISLIVVISIFIIIQLPLHPPPDKMIIYTTLLLAGILVFGWRKINLPVAKDNKNLIEALILVTAFSVVVHYSGGIRSYFLFLFLLPGLRISASSTFWYTLVVWFYTSVLIFGEVFSFPQENIQAKLGFISSPVNLAVLLSWSVALVAGYGRYLAAQLQKAQSSTTLANLEKERSINKLKDEFLFIISHELRGPVTAIRGYLELFMNNREKLDKGIQDLTRNAFNESDKLTDLIAELLDVSRLEVGKLKLKNEQFDIYKYIQEVLQKYTREANIKEIEMTLKPETKEIKVLADKDRVREVLQNLLENSLKYTEKSGKIWVWVDVKSDQAYVAVADTGKGMKEEELKNIFDRFYNSSIESQNVSAKEKSIGLGLFLAKNLIAKMGGRIFVESRVGKGSKFTFSLPLAKNK